ncbi:MAG: DUF4252 domain-containing protein, partial [Bacteroidales bacterium]|nr:DUF4252 domain-containing protein [Bacteroidales bacterium]
EGYYFLELNTNMLGLKNSGGKSTPGFSEKVNLLMVSCDAKEAGKGKAGALYDEFRQQINVDDYKGLVEVKSKGDNVEFLVKKDKETIASVIIMIKEKEETTLISVAGKFSLNDLTKFSGMQGCKGLEILGKICEE